MLVDTHTSAIRGPQISHKKAQKTQRTMSLLCFFVDALVVPPGKREKFLLAGLLALQFVVDNVFDFRVRLVAGEESAVDEQGGRPSYTISRAFLNISLNGGRVLSRIETLIEGLRVELQVDRALLE